MENSNPVLSRTRTAERYINRFYQQASEWILPEQAESIIAFDRQKSANDMAIGSRVKYISVLKQLAETVKKPFNEMTKEDIGMFIEKLNRTNGPNTVMIKKIQVKTFFKFIYGTDTYPEVVKWVSARRSKRHNEPVKKILSLEERKAMLNECTNQRDRAIITLLDQTGCRAEELILTRIKDVELDESGKFMTITLGKGKTGRRRIVITEGISDVQIWLNLHPLKNNPDAPAIIAFRGRNKHGHLQPKGLFDVIKTLAKNAGLKRNVHPHLFRHTRATICGKILKWNEATMRIFFGWAKDSNMPTVYTHLNADDVNERILLEAGIIKQTEMGETDIKDKECARCHTKNPFDAKYCHMCSLALDSKIAEKHNNVVEVSDEIMDISHEKRLEIEKAVEKYVEKMKMEIINKLKSGKGNFTPAATFSG